MQVLAHCFGGKVEKKDQREDGQFFVKVDTDCPLFDGLAAEQSVLLTHGDSVVTVVCQLHFTLVILGGLWVEGDSNFWRSYFWDKLPF